MDSVKAQLQNLLKQYKFVLIILLAGLLLMLLPDTGKEIPTADQESVQQEDPEARLEEILAQIQGVGKVRVMLTVAQGAQTLYIFDEDSNRTQDSESLRREAVILTDSSRAQSGLVSQVLPPVYLGAIIVCQGGDLPGVRLAVVEAVCDATGLTADKISVMKMK